MIRSCKTVSLVFFNMYGQSISSSLYLPPDSEVLARLSFCTYIHCEALFPKTPQSVLPRWNRKHARLPAAMVHSPLSVSSAISNSTATDCVLNLFSKCQRTFVDYGTLPRSRRSAYQTSL